MLKHLQKLLLIALLCVPWVTQAQELGDYTFSTDTNSALWVDMSSATQILSPSASDGLASSVRNIGFSFPFGENVYTQYSVNTDGNLRFGSTVTGTGSFTTPFSSSYANTNNPKINAFGCDGYGVSGSHYVKALNTTDENEEDMLVVEFCMGTFTTSTRNELYKWQIHLHLNGNIDIVFPAESQLPTTNPAVSHQCGMCMNSSDGWIISSSTNTATVFTNGSSTTNASGTWFDANRYYRFTRPVISCPKPAWALTTGVTSDEATVYWTHGGEESQWIVMLGDSVVDGAVIDTFYTFTNLDANTPYTVGIYALCDGGDTSGARLVSFRTACGDLTALPYTMGFETTDGVTSTGGSSSATFVNCWNRLNNGTSYFGYPYVGSSTTYAHTGSRGLYWYNTTTTGTYGDYQVVVLPPVDTTLYPINTLMLRFWAKTSSTSYQPDFLLGVMTDPTDITTFQQVGPAIRVSGTNWVEYEGYLSNYVGEGKYIALRTNRASWTAYVDDFTMMEIPACLEVRNVDVAATVGAAIVSWEASASDAECSAIVEYKTDDATEWIYAGTAQGLSYTITGLTAATDYNVRVKAVCNEGADTSEVWVYADFTTGSFGCQGLAENMIGNPSSTTTNYTVPVNNFYNNTMSQQLILASELSGTGPIRSVSFDYAYTSPTTDKTTCELWIGLTNLTSLSTSQFLDTSQMTKVYTGPLNMVNGWNTFSLMGEGDTVMYDGTSNIVVCAIDISGGYDGSAYVFRTSPATGMTMAYYSDSYNYYSDPSSMTHTTYSYRTNMKLEIGECQGIATCAAPAAAVSYVDTNNVTVSWAPGANETAWEVWYRMGTTGAFAVAASGVTDMDYTFTNLNPGTNYTFRVVNICEPDTFFCEVTAFTNCAPVDNVFEDFNSYATGTGGSINPCWYKNVYGTTTQYPYVNTINGEQALYFYGYTSGSTAYYDWVVGPEMRDSLNTYEVEFDMWKTSTTSYYTSRVLVGAMTDPTDISTFDTIADITDPIYGSWQSQYVSFEDYHGDGKYIAIIAPAPGIVDPSYTYAYNYLYLDNLYIGRRSTCAKPTRFHARDITANSAVLVWDSVGAYLNAKVKYNSINDINSATEVTVTDASTTLYGLTATTTYYCWLTAFCDEDSSRTVTCSFTTTDACNSVIDLTVSDVTTSMAAITWASNPLTPAASYTLEWKAADSSAWNSVVTPNTYYFLSGLAEGTSYQVRVIADCGDATATAVATSFTTLAFGTIGSDEGDYYLPTYPYYNYSISEQMWTANELSVYGDTIYGIYFNALSAISDRLMQMWVVDTNLADLSNSVYVPSTAMTLVMDDTVNIAVGWNYFAFNAPYVRDPNKNLVVLTYDHTGEYESFSGFVASTSTVNSLYAYQDGAPWSTTDLSDLDVEGVRAQMRLAATLEQPTCLAPLVVVSEATDNSIELTWVAGLNETSWSVDYRGMSDTTWIPVTASTTNTNITVTGLNPSTSYVFRVGAICTGNTMYAAVRGTTTCGAFSVPYVEDFNVYSSNEYNFDPCWYRGNTVSTNMPYIVNITGQGPCVLMPVGSYLILPEVSAPINTLQVRMQYVVAQTSIYAYVGVCSHPEDILSMTVIDTIWASEAGVAEWVTVPLDSYAGTEGYVTIFSPFNQTYYDNINIEMIPQCGTVDSISAENVTATTADITWQAGANGSSYIIEYGPITGTSGVGTTTVTASGTTLSLTGLQHSTTYHVDIYTVCPSLQDTSFAAGFAFATACDTVTLPYFEDFEHCNAPALTQTYMLPNCWEYVMTGSGSYTAGSYVPMLYSGTTYASSGNYSLRLYGRTVITLPEMPVPANELMISFHEYNSSTSSYRLVIGVCDSNWGNYQQSFVPVDTIAPTSASSWVTSYKLARCTGNGRYIAFTNYYQGSTSDYSYHYIDDITVDYLPSCLPVDNLHSSANTATTITMDWADYPNSTATEWEISYATSPLSNPANGTTAVVLAHPYTITGLSDTTQYYVYVRAICGAGDTSIWMAYGPTQPNQWIMRANMTDTLHMCGGVIYDEGGPTGNYFTPSQNSYIYLYPDAPQRLVSVSGWTHDESSLDYLVIYDGIGTGGTQLYTSSGVTNGTFADLTSTSGPLTLYFHTDGSVYYSGFEVRINCISTTCMVTGLDVDTAVTPSATALALMWDAVDDVTGYEIEYGTPGFNVGSGTQLTSNTNHIVISGLASMTNYEVYVRSLCAGNDTGSWAHRIFTTPMCDNVTELHSWDSTMSAYTSFAYGPVGYSCYNYSYVQTIVDSAHFAGLTEGITAFAFLPTLSTGNDKYNGITMWMANVSESNLTAGPILPDDSNHVFVQVISNASFNYTTLDWQIHTFDTAFTWDGHSNVLVAVKRDNGSYTCSANFSAHTASGTKTRYYYQDSGPISYTSPSASSSGTSSYVGDMKFFACGPACSSPNALPATNVTYNSATLNWNSPAEDFEVAVKAATDATWPAETAVTDNSYAVSGLLPATTYQFRVRAICDADEEMISDWAVGTFVTDSLPCFAPTELQATATTYTTAVLGWTNGGEETQWSIHVWNSTFNQEFTATGNPFTVTGLTQTTTYYATVKSICGGGLLESEESDTIEFTTATCAQVSGATATVIDGYSASVNWNDAGVTTYQIEYGYTGFTTGQGHTVTVENVTSYTLTGLEPETGYDVYVRAMCEAGVYGGWSPVASFTTPEVGISVADGMNVSIYPNPTSSSTTIALSGINGEVAVSIVDMNGRVVMSDSMSCEGDCTKTMEVSGLAQGAYFVRISGEGVNMVKKLVVK